MFTMIRLASVGGVAALRWVLHPTAYFSLFVAALFGHYMLATYYGRHRAKPLFDGSVPLWLTVAFVAFVAVPPLLMLPPLVLYLYFGGHHALNEGYMVLGGRAKSLDRDGRRLLTARVLLAYFVYLAVLPGDPRVLPIIVLPYWVLFVPLGVCFLAFLVLLRPVAKDLTRAELADLLSFEIVGVATACLVFVVDIRFFDAAFYHLFVWFFMPLVRAKNLRGQLKYVVQLVVATSLFFLISPWFALHPVLNYEFWVIQSFAWAYVHISSSIVVSGFNPKWLTHIFLPRPAARA